MANINYETDSILYWEKTLQRHCSIKKIRTLSSVLEVYFFLSALPEVPQLADAAGPERHEATRFHVLSISWREPDSVWRHGSGGRQSHQQEHAAGLCPWTGEPVATYQSLLFIPDTMFLNIVDIISCNATPSCDAVIH